MPEIKKKNRNQHFPTFLTKIDSGDILCLSEMELVIKMIYKSDISSLKKDME